MPATFGRPTAPGDGTLTTEAELATALVDYQREDSWIDGWIRHCEAGPLPENVPTLAWSSSYTTALSSPVEYKPAVCGIGSQTTGWSGSSDTVFRYWPGTFQTANGGSNDLALYGETKPGGVSQAARWPLAVSFVTASTVSVVEVAYYSLASRSPLMIEVDGHLVSDTYVRPDSGTTNAGKVTLTFPFAAARTIRVMGEGAWGLVAVRVPTGQSISRPSAPARTVAIIGDSFVNGADYSYSRPSGAGCMETFAPRLARYMGADDVVLAGIGGTGWTYGTDTGGGANTYITRTDDVVAFSPDVLVFSSSVNDGSTAGTLGAAVTAALAVASTVPDIYVIGVIRDGYSAANTAIRTAAEAAGATYVSLPSFLAGTGTVSARTGDGTNDVLLLADNVHPTLAGHRALARAAFRLIGSI